MRKIIHITLVISIMLIAIFWMIMTQDQVNISQYLEKNFIVKWILLIIWNVSRLIVCLWRL